MGKIWYCKIGEAEPTQEGADLPMRAAVSKAFLEITGKESSFIFSGWGASLTESERAVVEDREPVLDHVSPRLAAAIKQARLAVDDAEKRWPENDWMLVRISRRHIEELLIARERAAQE
jgi:hypothetical protein